MHDGKLEDPSDPPCLYCGCGDFVTVHGHDQCTRCGNNIAPYCEGYRNQNTVHIKWTEDDDELYNNEKLSKLRGGQ